MKSPFTPFADPVDVKSAIFGEHVDWEFEQPVLVLAKHFGDVIDAEDMRDGRQGQAARLVSTRTGRQFPGQKLVDPVSRVLERRVGNGAADKAESLAGCKSLHRQLPGSDG